eukprot:814444-Rhodomonas_salina.1
MVLVLQVEHGAVAEDQRCPPDMLAAHADVAVLREEHLAVRERLDVLKAVCDALGILRRLRRGSSLLCVQRQR